MTEFKVENNIVEHVEEPVTDYKFIQQEDTLKIKRNLLEHSQLLVGSRSIDRKMSQ